MLLIDSESRNESVDDQLVLVPIRLDLDFDSFRLKDAFTWNIHGRTLAYIPQAMSGNSF